MLDDDLAQQCGVLSCEQAMAGGLSRRQIAHRLASGRWQRIFPGVYATFTGPVPRPARFWAALLKAGPDAILSHETAAELVGLIDRPRDAVHVTVPATRHPQQLVGVVVHRSRHAIQRRHPTRTPPQTRVEDTVLDLVHACPSAEEAMSWLARAVGSRVTTGQRLAAAAARRTKLRHRSLLAEAIADVATGSHSVAELRYLREVERSHGLPASERQFRRAGRGASRYDDVRYLRYETVVEIDGRAAHPEHTRWRDMRRDNAAVLDGNRVLRYGLADLTSAPCRVAAQVIEALRAGGWRGTPQRCRRATCVVPCA